MESLLATYASSDEEEDEPQQNHQPNFFSSLPPPKSQPGSDSTPSTSLFSKLPQPKSQKPDPFSLNPKPKKIVQFRPPIPTKTLSDDEDDDNNDNNNNNNNNNNNKVTKKNDNLIPQAPSVKSFLSSIPAPRNSGSLGALPSAAGVGRRSILEADVPELSNPSNSNVVKDLVNKSSNDQMKYDNNNNNINNNSVNADNTAYGDYANVAATSADYYENVGTGYSSYGPVAPASDDYGSYSGYGSYGQYESKWIDRSGGDLQPEMEMEMPVARPAGKRGRNEIPEEVIEVNQDELMKNRPREDQAKLTGIAFGPSYQPTSSTKAKPSKLHKRKHQIGSLYFDMRSKEMELAERRSRGFLTKAETQAKYGW